MRHRATVEPRNDIPAERTAPISRVVCLGTPASSELRLSELDGEISQIAQGATGLDQLTSAARQVEWPTVGAVILHVPQVHSFTSRLYRVHPRRNDRFLSASDALIRRFPSVDFTSIHFAGHLLRTLWQADAERFEMVRRQLREAWHARMAQLIGMIDAPILTVAQNPPPGQAPWLPGAVAADEGWSHMVHASITMQPTGTSTDNPCDSAATKIIRALGAIKHKSPPPWRGTFNQPIGPLAQSFSVNSGTAVKRSATSPKSAT